jgi:hypothetical protein
MKRDGRQASQPLIGAGPNTNNRLRMALSTGPRARVATPVQPTLNHCPRSSAPTEGIYLRQLPDLARADFGAPFGPSPVSRQLRQQTAVAFLS